VPLILLSGALGPVIWHRKHLKLLQLNEFLMLKVLKDLKDSTTFVVFFWSIDSAEWDCKFKFTYDPGCAIVSLTFEKHAHIAEVL
jgi:hypothetical protein